MSEPINRFIFPTCAQGNNAARPSWQAGYVDGILRTAGEQCSCPHHWGNQAASLAKTDPVEKQTEAI